MIKLTFSSITLDFDNIWIKYGRSNSAFVGVSDLVNLGPMTVFSKTVMDSITAEETRHGL